MVVPLQEAVNQGVMVEEVGELLSQMKTRYRPG
jgi:hypothetical protein